MPIPFAFPKPTVTKIADSRHRYVQNSYTKSKANRATEVQSTDIRNAFTPLSVTFTSPIFTKLKLFLQIYKDISDTEIYANCTRNVVNTSKNSGTLWSWNFTVPIPPPHETQSYNERLWTSVLPNVTRIGRNMYKMGQKFIYTSTSSLAFHYDEFREARDCSLALLAEYLTRRTTALRDERWSHLQGLCR